MPGAGVTGAGSRGRPRGCPVGGAMTSSTFGSHRITSRRPVLASCGTADPDHGTLSAEDHPSNRHRGRSGHSGHRGAPRERGRCEGEYRRCPGFFGHSGRTCPDTRTSGHLEHPDTWARTPRTPRKPDTGQHIPDNPDIFGGPDIPGHEDPREGPAGHARTRPDRPDKPEWEISIEALRAHSSLYRPAGALRGPNYISNAPSGDSCRHIVTHARGRLGFPFLGEASQRS